MTVFEKLEERVLALVRSSVPDAALELVSDTDQGFSAVVEKSVGRALEEGRPDLRVYLFEEYGISHWEIPVMRWKFSTLLNMRLRDDLTKVARDDLKARRYALEECS